MFFSKIWRVSWADADGDHGAAYFYSGEAAAQKYHAENSKAGWSANLEEVDIKDFDKLNRETSNEVFIVHVLRTDGSSTVNRGEPEQKEEIHLALNELKAAQYVNSLKGVTGVVNAWYESKVPFDFITQDQAIKQLYSK